MGIKGCWTCRERKVRCDLGRPVCGNCTKTRRSCGGYGMQLSWPREGDKRRALTHHVTKRPGTALRRHRNGGNARFFFLNSSTWDVCLSDALQERRDLGQYSHTLSVPHLPYLPSHLLIGSKVDLLDFYIASTARIMTPVVDGELAHYILRVALDNPSHTSNLALEGIFTVASLQLHGRLGSLGHRSKLISMLRDNLSHTDRGSVLQNLISTMLLYQCDVLTLSKLETGWNFFLCGAKKIVAASSATARLHQDDSVVLMDWVYYHEVSSEFSLRHWADADSLDRFCKGPLAARPRELAPHDSKTSSRITCPMAALDLIRIICKRPSTYPCEGVPYDGTDMRRMKELKDNLQEIVGTTGSFHDMSDTPLTQDQMKSYLYACAALIYFNRAVRGISAYSFEHARLVREAVLITLRLGTCESAWPLFILACEARDDEQRLQMLDILSKTEQESLVRSNHVPLIRSMVEAIWNQYDLNIDSDVNYVETLHAVISTAPSLPLFA